MKISFFKKNIKIENTQISLIILTVLFSLKVLANSNSAPLSRVFYAGGGAELAKPQNSFDTPTISLLKSLKGSPHLFSAVYNGGHPTSEKMSKALIGKNLPVINKRNFDLSLDQIEKELIQPNYTQLVVIINTHGEPAKTGELTHQVLGQDNQEKIKLDRLLALKEKAKKAGVKLALIDMSCHSGLLHRLADENTCTITGSDKEVGYIKDSQVLFEEFGRGQTLEQSFLNMRQKTQSFGQPVIGTAAGIKTQEQLVFFEQEMLTATPIMTKVQRAESCEVSPPQPAIKKLAQTLTQLKTSLAQDFVQGQMQEQVVKDIERYQSFKKAYLASIEKNKEIANQRFCAPEPITGKNLCTNGRYLYRIYMESPQDLTYSAHRDLFRSAFESNNLAFKFTQIKVGKAEAHNNLIVHSGKVAQHERKIYADLYSAYKQSYSNKSEPCAQIIF